MISERIKELRQSFGYNQPTLAKMLGISKQCISNWESGYIQPSLDMLIKMTKVFSVSADYLLHLTEVRSLDITGLSGEQIASLECIVRGIRYRGDEDSTSTIK